MDKRLTYNTEIVDNCPVCGGEGKFDVAGDSDELGETKVIRIYACSKCATVYHNPRMTNGVMDEYYSSGIYRETHETDVDGEKNRADRLIRLLGLYDEINPERCLDVGSARGWLLEGLRKKYGAEVVGYDLYNDPEAAVEPITIQADITGKFDLITCIHALEHFHNPVAELIWMASLLTDDGVLLIEIPTIKKIIHPHPVLFSKESIPILMGYIGLEYEYLDPAHHIRIILARKGAKKDVNSAEFYDDIYLTKPEKWATDDGVRRDAFAFRAVNAFYAGEAPGFMLDFGCGNGHTLQYFNSFWPKTIYCGVDISEVALKLARWSMPKSEFYTSLPDGTHFYDLITIMGVAEHFENPAEELRKIGEHLFAGGMIYLEVPNVLGDGEEGFRQTEAGSGQHEWHLKRKSWEKIIKDAGFEIVKSLTGENATWEFIWILKKVN